MASQPASVVHCMVAVLYSDSSQWWCRGEIIYISLGVPKYCRHQRRIAYSCRRR